MGATADYVRWRVAVGTNDAATLRSIHASFDSLDLTTLKQIITASQLSGVALDDADRATTLVVDRTTDPAEHGSALYFANEIALNRGRPHRADSLLRLRREVAPTPSVFWRSTTLANLFADGETASAEESARERQRWLVGDTLGKIPLSPGMIADVSQQTLWDWKHGRVSEAEAVANWLGRNFEPAAARLVAYVDVTRMLVASSRRRSDAASLRARVDSEARQGCCNVPRTTELWLATAYEMAGNDSAALAALRRGRWVGTMFLSTYLLREARIAARLGDRRGAIRAYDHYLALRSDPEPRLVPQRDSARAEMNRLVSGSRPR